MLPHIVSSISLSLSYTHTHTHIRYHSLTYSFVQVVKAMFGVFEYEVWDRAFPQMSTWWLILVEGAMIIVVINCVIAILMQSFEAVTRDNEIMQGWYFGTRPFSMEVYVRTYMMVFRCRKRRRCCCGESSAFQSDLGERQLSNIGDDAKRLVSKNSNGGSNDADGGRHIDVANSIDRRPSFKNKRSRKRRSQVR